MTYTSDQRTAIQQLLSEILSRVKPEETFLVETVFDRQVDVGGRTDALGFGGDATVLLWILPLAKVLQEFAATTFEGFSKKWGEQVAEWLWKKKASRLEASDLMTFRSAMVQRLSAEGIAVEACERIGDTALAVLLAQPEILRQMMNVR
jgi:hypothetical protein